jgi:hypothetical protein
MLERYVAPSKYVEAPYGTLCKVIDSKELFYVQVSQNTDEYQWETVESVLAHTFKHMFDNEEFVKELLKLYNDKDLSKDKLLRILKNS